MTTFADLGLSPKILNALEKTTLKTPTPIQAQAIPHIMAGRDLMGLAQTGTGKTAAFGLPLLHRLLDIGPGPGERGGNIVFEGDPAAIREADTLTGQYLSGKRSIDAGRRLPVEAKTPKLILEGAREHNLKNVSVQIPLGRFVCITGVSGSGKSTLMQNVLLPALLKAKGKPTEAPGDFDRLLGDDWIEDVVFVDQSPIGKTARSNPISYVGAFDPVRKRFAAAVLAKERGYTAGTFSFNSGDGRCPTCGGNGFEHVEMQFLSDVYLRCPDCDGKRFRGETLEVRIDGAPGARRADGSAFGTLDIAQVLDLTVNEALTFFAHDRDVRIKLQPLSDVGLDYLRLGQPVPTLSGGEAQRLKLAGFLAQAAAAGLTDASAPGYPHARTGRKGAELYMPLRIALTGRRDGPELAPLLAALPDATLRSRLRALASST